MQSGTDDMAVAQCRGLEFQESRLGVSGGHDFDRGRSLPSLRDMHSMREQWSRRASWDGTGWIVLQGDPTVAVKECRSGSPGVPPPSECSAVLRMFHVKHSKVDSQVQPGIAVQVVRLLIQKSGRFAGIPFLRG